jgi:hypothetical protein
VKYIESLSADEPPVAQYRASVHMSAAGGRLMKKTQNLLMSAVLQFLSFGAFSLLMVLNEPAPSAAVVALFVAGELGGSSVLCSVIVKRFRQGSFPDWLQEVIAGYVVSHICILNLLHAGPFSGQGARVPAHGTLGWMELMLRVSLGLVLVLTTAVLSKARVRRMALPHIRKFFAAA